jgi:hypothetical protein
VHFLDRFSFEAENSYRSDFSSFLFRKFEHRLVIINFVKLCSALKSTWPFDDLESLVLLPRFVDSGLLLDLIAT